MGHVVWFCFSHSFNEPGSQANAMFIVLEGERDALREHAACVRTGKERGAKGHAVRSGFLCFGSMQK